MMRLALVCALLVILSSSLSAQSMSREELKAMMATFINLHGFLCAKVVEVIPLKLKDTYEVTCIEYRDGERTVDYLFAMRSDGIIVQKR